MAARAAALSIFRAARLPKAIAVRQIMNIPGPWPTAASRVAPDGAFNVIGLGAGEPDFDTPDNIKAAAVKAFGKDG